jgi:hypothetical protein
MGSLVEVALPDSKSTELHLSHPTEDECNTIWTNTSASWRDSLSVPVYLKESLFLTTVPLAKDGGMTTWILVDKNLPPDQRPILCSCESFHKRSYSSDSNGNVTEAVVHGIAGVFCPPAYRGRGYAARMMRELAKELYTWQSDKRKCIGSILYSDIGKTYYTNLGWHPNPTNSHLVFQPENFSTKPSAEPIPKINIEELCRRDDGMIRKSMEAPAEGITARITIVPDLDHMLWHIGKEEFACDILFGKVPHAKGAIAGPPGSQVWAIWTHRYYGHPDSDSPNNTLYILRLVIENHTTGTEGGRQRDVHSAQVDYLKAVLQAAQAEAFEWRLDQVKLWEPTPLVQQMIDESAMQYAMVEREEDSIASGLWYDENGHEGPTPQWINKEHYAWC